MYPPSFDYRRADSVEGALEALADADHDLRVLAGGHSLLPDLKAGRTSPDAVLDVGRLERLRSVEATDDGVEVGALVTHADLADSPLVERRAPLLAAAAGEVGDPQVRNCGTVGGNLAYAHPAADPPAAALAADATLVVRSADRERTVPAPAFFLADGGTDVAADELVTAVRVPHDPDERVAYVRRTHPATGYAAVGVAAALAVSGGAVSACRVAATGAFDRPVRLSAVENELLGESPGEAVGAAADRAGEGVDARVRSDPQVSRAFREHLLGEYVRRALAAALDGRKTADVGGSDTGPSDGGGSDPGPTADEAGGGDGDE